MSSGREGQSLGNYELLHLIGQGSSAEVYVGKQRYIETIVAIKVLQRIGPETNELFRREARTIAHLQHPHIVHIYDFGIEDQTPYLVMEYTPIGSLRAVHPKGSRVSCEQIIDYVKQIASALDYAHQQRVIHRDIKPENILLNARQEVVLSDFGLAVVLRPMESLATQNQAGTPLYMAPEQIRSHPSPASDQYALAVMVYEWLCGEPPFRGSLYEVFTQHLYQSPPDLCARVPGLPAAIENVVFKSLAKDPQERFPTMQDFATALESACAATWLAPQHDRSSDVSRTELCQPKNDLPTSPAVPNVPYPTPSTALNAPYPTPPLMNSSQKNLAAQDKSPLEPSAPGPMPTGQTALLPLARDAVRPLFNWKKLLLLLAAVLVVTSGLAYFLLVKSAPDPQTTYDNLIQQPTSLTLHSANWFADTSPSPTPLRCTLDSSNGAYSAAVVPKQAPDFPHYYSTYCWNWTANYHNFLYQADVRIDRGGCAGLLFRLTQGTLKNLGQPSGYYLGICPDWSRHQGGTCQFFLYVDGAVTESDQSCPGIVNNSGSVDTIAILAQNDTLNFFINKKFAFARKDTKYPSGYIAVVVASHRPPSGKPGDLAEQANFTNLNVWVVAD